MWCHDAEFYFLQRSSLAGAAADENKCRGSGKIVKRTHHILSRHGPDSDAISMRLSKRGKLQRRSIDLQPQYEVDSSGRAVGRLGLWSKSQRAGHALLADVVWASRFVSSNAVMIESTKCTFFGTFSTGMLIKKSALSYLK